MILAADIGNSITTLALFEEGTKLAGFLHKLLDEAEQKVTVLRESGEEIPLEQGEEQEG